MLYFYLHSINQFFDDNYSDEYLSLPNILQSKISGGGHILRHTLHAGQLSIDTNIIIEGNTIM